MRGAFTGADTNKKGLIEVAERGTIFLDEIGEMNATMQVKLLRVLQDRRFRRLGGTEEVQADIRVIAATNQDLPKLVADGRFREDLFYRINVIPMHLPPLRERREDIPLLAEHFLQKFAAADGEAGAEISQRGAALLQAYRWPGNVRELENVIERAVALEQTPVVLPDTLPADVRAGTATLADGRRLAGAGRSRRIAGSRRRLRSRSPRRGFLPPLHRAGARARRRRAGEGRGDAGHELPSFRYYAKKFNVR